MKRKLAYLSALSVALCMGLVFTMTPTATAGEGDSCMGDIDGDGQVNVFDVLEVVGNFGECAEDKPCPADLNDDGAVNVSDLLIVLNNFGPCDAPACESNADCDDEDPCTIDICIQGSCHHIPIPDCE